jgi:uncharacterized UPF0160 family protein
MMKQKKERSFGTHDGSFHADEVTACALLLFFKLIDKDKIIRTRDPKILSNCEYVCDVGGIHDPAHKLFDHHQAEYQGPLSSAGMILKYLRDIGKADQNQYEFFKRTLMDGVDLHDNGKDPQIPGLCTYSHIIASFIPIGYDADASTLDAAFMVAVQFAEGLLDRLWKRYEYNHAYRKTVQEVMDKSESCLIFEENIPWMDAFFEMNGADHKASFVIMPSDKHWKLRGIPPTYEQRMQVRVPLPEEWAGLLEKELREKSGIAGAIFCHKGRFFSVWETREDALEALRIALERAEKKSNLNVVGLKK